MVAKQDLLLGKLCIAKKVLDKEQLKRALNTQESKNLPLGIVLLEQKLLTMETLQTLTEQQQKNISTTDSREKGESLAFLKQILKRKIVATTTLKDLVKEYQEQEEISLSLAEIFLQQQKVPLLDFIEAYYLMVEETIICHGCEKEFRLLSLEPGKKVRCKHCKSVILVPSLEDELQPLMQNAEFTSTISEQDIFAGYEILEVIAEGGMGVIYRAQKQSSGQIVAVKVLKEAVGSSRETKDRFDREAKTLALLRHPNIVSILEVGIENKVPYFTMDYIEGEPLSQIIKKRALEIDLVVKILVKICEAVHYAHSQGVIHRDLKPSNILLTVDNEPKIIDFGLAKCIDSITTVPTKTGSTLGTLCYMSPEQARGKLGLVGPRSDIYSLGVIFYEMLTGQNPFIGDSVFEVYQKILTVDPPPPSQANSKISYHLDNICMKCLKKDSFHRYKTSELLIQDLEKKGNQRSFLEKILGFFSRMVRRK